jgi:hypothetical protein
MANIRNPDEPIVPQDLGLDDADINDTGIPETLTQDVIDDLVSSPSMSVEDRLSRLVDIRAHLAARAASEFGDNDAASLLAEVERVIGGLQTEADALADEPEGYEALDPALDIDPLEHRETLSPDDDDLIDLERSEEDEDDDDLLDDDDDDDEDDDEDAIGDETEDGDDLETSRTRDAAKRDLDEVLDPKEWEADRDGFDSEKGVR